MLKWIMTAAALAVLSQTALAQTAKPPADDRRQNVLAERKTAESQYRQDRIAALRKGDDCIKAAATQKALADCEKAEAAELRAATEKAKSARAKIKGEVRDMRVDAQSKRKNVAPKPQ